MASGKKKLSYGLDMDGNTIENCPSLVSAAVAAIYAKNHGHELLTLDDLSDWAWDNQGSATIKDLANNHRSALFANGIES